MIRAIITEILAFGALGLLLFKLWYEWRAMKRRETSVTLQDADRWR